MISALPNGTHWSPFEADVGANNSQCQCPSANNSSSAPVQIMTTLRFQIVQTLSVPITSPQRVWCCVFTVHVIPHVPLKPIGTHLTVETLLHHVFIVHVIPHVSIGAHLTVHMSTVFHMWTVKWAHCAKQTLLFVITTLKVCWCDAACHLLCVHGSCDSSCFHWSLFGCSVVITTLRCVGLMLPAIRSATASVFPSIHLKLTAHWFGKWTVNCMLIWTLLEKCPAISTTCVSLAHYPRPLHNWLYQSLGLFNSCSIGITWAQT